MAFTKFTFEGNAVLGYFASEHSDRDRAVRIKDDNDEGGDAPAPAPAPVPVPVPVGSPAGESIGTRVETLIARSLGFPNDAEFEEMHQRMEALRERDLQPADGTPDVTRENLRLRITVEVVDD